MLKLRSVAPLNVTERRVPAQQETRVSEGDQSDAINTNSRSMAAPCVVRLASSGLVWRQQHCETGDESQARHAKTRGRDARGDEPRLAQLVESHEVLVFAKTINPAPAKRKRIKVLVDDVENIFGRPRAEGNVLRLELSHVVAHFTFLNHSSAGARAGRPCYSKHHCVRCGVGYEAWT